MKRDRRRLLARADLAAEELRGQVEAARFVVPEPMSLGVEACDLLPAPQAEAPRDTQVLFGEELRVLEIAKDWAFVQLASDGYVGYVAAAALRPFEPRPTHEVAAPRTLVYASASIKDRVVVALPMGARVRCVSQSAGFLELGDGGFVYAAHLAALGSYESDAVGIAERFLHAPYLWGGKSWLGLDCSGLVQVSLARAGVRAPRDADMMEAELGTWLSPGKAPLKRGDLVFWKGHVGLMQDDVSLLHANAHHMAVASEPLELVRARIVSAGGGDITSVRRLG